MQFTSSAPEEIVTTPYMCNRTSEQQFKLSKNGLIWRKHYDQLSDFHKNFNIFDYLSDPLTKKEAKIREIWMDNCKKRYNQISSMYTRKCLPFLEYTNSGVLTNCNSTNAFPSELRNRSSFTLLTQKRENRDYNDIQRILTSKQNTSHKVMTFNGEENKDYYTCCRVLPQMVVVGCRNSLLKIFM